MTDSPYQRTPLDAQEQPILDKLLIIRDKLLLLKQDRTKYIKSQDVINYYDQVIEQVHALNEIRVNKREEQNRLDTVLDDCFQLISLCFLTIGRNNEAPAAYSVVSTIKRLLDHLREAGFFTRHDLEGIAIQLEKIQGSVDRGKTHHSEDLLILLDTRIQHCRNTLAELTQALSQLSPELTPIHDKLVMILRSLSGLNTKKTFPVDEVKDFQRQLKEIESGLQGHPQALAPSELSAEEQYAVRLRKLSYAGIPGQEIVLDLIGRCLLWSDIMLNRQGHIDERFRDKFDELSKIRVQLEKLSLTQAWSLRETDLYGYQRKLDRYDEARVDGNFLDAEGKPADLFEQRGLLYLLRKCYVTIYHMITSSEPVSEALLPIYNQLMTLRRCLLEVQRSGGVSSPRELYPYSMKLNSIDNMRVDGKFVVNDDIPEGQGSVSALLAECFDLAYELRTEAEKDEEEEEDEDEQEGAEHHEEGEETNVHEDTPPTNDEEEDELDEGGLPMNGGGLARTTSRKPGMGEGLSRTTSRKPGAPISIGVK